MTRLSIVALVALLGLCACASYFRASPALPFAETTDTAFQVRWESRGVKGLTLDQTPVPAKGVRAVPIGSESCEGTAAFDGTGGKERELPARVKVPRRPSALRVAVALDSIPIATTPVTAGQDTIGFAVPAGSQPKITLTTRCAGFCRFTGISQSGASGRSNTVIVNAGECWQGETITMMTGDSRRYRITPLLKDSAIAGPPIVVVLRQAER